MNRMIQSIGLWWDGRSVREQRMLMVMGLLVAAVLIWLLVLRPAWAWREAAAERRVEATASLSRIETGLAGQTPTDAKATLALAEKRLGATGKPIFSLSFDIWRWRGQGGTIAAGDLAAAGVLDVLSSDYVPISLIHAPFVLADKVPGIGLAQAIAMVTATPARRAGLADRGRIAEGLRADLVRVHRPAGVPVVCAVWRQGKRVA